MVNEDEGLIKDELVYSYKICVININILTSYSKVHKFRVFITTFISRVIRIPFLDFFDFIQKLFIPFSYIVR